MAANPTFDVRTLMDRAHLSTARALADRCGVNRKAIHNRVRRGHLLGGSRRVRNSLRTVPVGGLA